jgi:hypothetical protein
MDLVASHEPGEHEYREKYSHHDVLVDGVEDAGTEAQKATY